MNAARHQRGVTLIELIMAILIIGIAAGALFAAVGSIIGRSANPMLQAQALEIAESHLEEILTRPLPAGFNATGCPALGAAPDRPNYADVCEYTRLNGTIGNVLDAFGHAIPGLSEYGVRVAVSAEALGGVPSDDCARITVEVTDPAGSTLQLIGYRSRP